MHFQAAAVCIPGGEVIGLEIYTELVLDMQPQVICRRAFALWDVCLQSIVFPPTAYYIQEDEIISFRI